MKKLIQKHVLMTYFILAYFISWGGILLSFGADGIRVFQGENVLTEGFSRQLLFIWLAMLAGPSIAGILLTRIVDGRKGLQKLFASIINWNVHIKWYAAALLIVPLILWIVFFSLSLVVPKFFPASLFGFGITVGLIGGFFEEIGWTGFALPKLQQRYSSFKAAVILGVLHTFWHLLSDSLGSINLYKELYVLHFFLWILALTAFRVLAVWIYNHTGSILLAQLAHAGFTGGQIMLTPPGLSSVENVTWYAIFTILLCIMACIILYKDKRMFFSKENKAQ